MKKAQTVVSDPFLFPSSLQTCLAFSENRPFLTIARAFLFMGAMSQIFLWQRVPWDLACHSEALWHGEIQKWFTSERWEPVSNICLSAWGWAQCTSSSGGALAQLAAAAPADSPPPVTRDPDPGILGTSTVMRLAKGYVLSWKAAAELRSCILMGKQSCSFAKAYNSNSYETGLIGKKKKKKFVLLGFLVCRLQWFTFKMIFLPFWCYAFPPSKDWDSYTNPDFRA